MSKKLLSLLLITQIIFSVTVLSGCSAHVVALTPSPQSQAKGVPDISEAGLADSTKPAESTIVKTTDASEYFYDITKSPKYEMRGVWIATVLNIDMPAKMNKEAFTKWANDACQNVSDRNQNAIIFQVKPTADALYKSELAPWSAYITGGKQGTDPGYDPLEIMINAAHSRGIELHAWINPYRVTMSSQKLDDLSRDNAAIKNPSWVIGYNNQYYLNPGLPEVRKYLVDCVAELAQNYDVDAIHMDDYFYPYPSTGIEFQDGDAFKKYGAGFTNVADWRRNNVNMLVSEINKAIKDIKPYVQYGVSPFGVWRNIANDPTGSNTKGGAQNYDSLYADTRQWLKDGSIDYIAPQIYWSRISAAANYTVLIDWWNGEVHKYTSKEHGGEKAHPVNLYIGLADYKVGTKNDESWEKTNTEITGQITDNNSRDAITGQIHYNYSSVIGNSSGYFDLVKSTNYKVISLTPPSPWNGLEVAPPPEKVTAESTTGGVKIKITSSENSSNTRKYVIYRFDVSGPKEYKNENIAAVVYNNGQTEYLDKNVVKEGIYVYSVRPVSNTGIESETSVSADAIKF